MVKNVYILSLTGWNDFIPVLWPSAKTYYEINGKKVDDYNWVIPVCEMYSDIEVIKSEILKTKPDIFGVSLYVWNYEKSLELCKWVKETFPSCLVITGGPHQYFKHHQDWFKKHWFIDASLPSEVYGEIAICDILDNLESNNKINWNKVEQIVYPNKTRSMFLRSSKATYKREFKWNYSAFEAQHNSLKEYVETYYAKSGRSILHGKIETTRGCPYECTFCDWGGGIGTKVVLKDLDCVKKDLDVLLDFDITSLYVCDANFGINRDRDVEVIQYIADKKTRSNKDVFPNVQYGGYAKTNKHFDHLKKIFTIEAKNNLSYVYKISQQSYNDKILENVKRSDLRANEHFELAEYLRKNYFYEATVELILGLPGTTIDTWYNEFNKPYEWNILIRGYEWHLLPEAESFSVDYREKFKIKTAKKWYNSSEYTIPSEVVVETASYTRADYEKMLTIYAFYNLFVQGGIYKKSIDTYLQKNNIQFGDFLRKFFDECYDNLKNASLKSFTHFEEHLTKFTSPEVNDVNQPLKWEVDGPEFVYYVYFMYEYFKNFEALDPVLKGWLLGLGIPTDIVENDSEKIYSINRINHPKKKLLSTITFDAYKNEDEFIADVSRSTQYTYGNLLVSNKKFSLNLWKK